MIKKSSRGQVLVEYMLLMTIAVVSAAFLLKAIAGRGTNSGDHGFIVKWWDMSLKKIGNDIPDCPGQKNYNSSSLENSIGRDCR